MRNLQTFNDGYKRYRTITYHMVLHYIYQFSKANQIYVKAWQYIIDHQSDLLNGTNQMPILAIFRDFCFKTLVNQPELHKQPIVFNSDKDNDDEIDFSNNKIDITTMSVQCVDQFLDSLSIEDQEIWFLSNDFSLSTRELVYICDKDETYISNKLININKRLQNLLNEQQIDVSIDSAIKSHKDKSPNQALPDVPEDLSSQIKAYFISSHDTEKIPFRSSIKKLSRSTLKGLIALSCLVIIGYMINKSLNHPLSESESPINVSKDSSFRNLYHQCESYYSQREYETIIEKTHPIMELTQGKPYVYSLLVLRRESLISLKELNRASYVDQKIKTLFPLELARPEGK